MPYSRDRANQFWLEFEEGLMPQATPELRKLYDGIRGVDGTRLLWELHRAGGTYPDGFVEAVAPMAGALNRFCELQVEAIEQHFGIDSSDLRRAFEDFGQGVLFDDRRRRGYKIHKMDLDPPIGYHRWHAFIRAAVLTGTDEATWLRLDRLVGLAWAIQSAARPEEDRPDNPRLPNPRIRQLRDLWLQLGWDELDAAFDSSPYPDDKFLPP